MRFEEPRDKSTWRAGIFHGPSGRSLGQVPTQSEVRQVISESVAQGIEEGAGRAADKLERRYSGTVKLLIGAVLVMATASVVTAVLIATERK